MYVTKCIHKQISSKFNNQTKEKRAYDKFDGKDIN